MDSCFYACEALGLTSGLVCKLKAIDCVEHDLQEILSTSGFVGHVLLLSFPFSFFFWGGGEGRGFYRLAKQDAPGAFGIAA